MAQLFGHYGWHVTKLYSMGKNWDGDELIFLVKMSSMLWIMVSHGGREIEENG